VRAETRQPRDIPRSAAYHASLPLNSGERQFAQEQVAVAVGTINMGEGIAIDAAGDIYSAEAQLRG
jgi:hypothetical protein